MNESSAGQHHIPNRMLEYSFHLLLRYYRSKRVPSLLWQLQDCLPKIKLDRASEWKKAQDCGISSWDLTCESTEGASPAFTFGTGRVWYHCRIIPCLQRLRNKPRHCYCSVVGHGDIKEALPLDTHLTAGTARGDPVADLASHASSACPQSCPLSQVYPNTLAILIRIFS